MKRVIWFPTGRALWFDLADRLDRQGVATPVLWLGDDRHLVRARQRFPAARVLSLRALAKGDRTVPPTPPAGRAGAFWQHPGAAVARDHALKLMDRDDHFGRLSPLEREAWLHELVLWATAEIDATGAEALVMAEAPHSAPMLVMAAVAQALGLPVLCFASWPLFPGMVLTRGLHGPALPVPGAGDDRPASPGKGASAQAVPGNPATGDSADPDPDRARFLAAAGAEIDAYLARFAGDGYAFQPRYMQLQAQRAGQGRGPGRWLWRAAAGLQLLAPRRARAWRQRGALRRALAALADPMPAGPYVYFPLHYEPERTTTPDGGAFHDQLRALARLRALLPAGVAIAVKEHPSVFNPFMNGHLGRHPRQYAALRRIAGVHLLPDSADSAALLAGAVGVAAITGTAALEAAAKGKPALVFGHPWFRGCPGIATYAPGCVWPGPEGAARPDRAALGGWLHARLRATVLPGCVNPSNEKYFAPWYADGWLHRHETDALTRALALALVLDP